ncbi:MAG: heme exporter protein CcmD [Sterolibacterium sp.]|nr:heme exporter protein CcmD [Sterolibacterium sp.]
MQWNSVAEFFSMGGYGLYVWGSFGVTALILLMEPLIVKQRQSQAVRAIRREKMATRQGD